MPRAFLRIAVAAALIAVQWSCATDPESLGTVAFPEVDLSLPRVEDQLSWRVAEPFRLIKGPGWTAEMLRRYRYYLKNGHEDFSTPIPPTTWWNANDAEYDRGYDLTPAMLDVSVAAPSNFNGDCRWTVDGVDLKQPSSCNAPAVIACSVSRGCMVQVGVVGTAKATKPVVLHPRNIVVATLGDSYASGEGVPDSRSTAIKGIYTHHNAVWIDKRCHRSLFSGHAVSGLLYTIVNPHVAVTYVSYACSGALLSSGLLAGYAGQDPADCDHPLDPQWDKLSDLLHRKPADFLTLSFGGNDVDFGDIVRNGMFENDRIFNAMVPQLVEQRLGKLRVDARKAGDKEHETPLARHLVLVQYPNPTVLVGNMRSTNQVPTILDPPVNECAGGFAGTVHFAPLILAKSLHLLGGDFDVSKVATVEIQVSKVLRDFGTEFAGLMGAEPIPNPPDGPFAQHGFCAAGLTTKKDTRWINTVRDSFRTQGTGVIYGAMHPNIRGQGMIASVLTAG
jgi:hypothetical protein